MTAYNDQAPYTQFQLSTDGLTATFNGVDEITFTNTASYSDGEYDVELKIWANYADTATHDEVTIPIKI